MKFRHPALALVVLAAVLAAVLFGVYRYRHRFVSAPADLQRFLPLPVASADVSTFYMDVSALRRGGYLDLFTTSPAANDADYRRFVTDTNFDYTRDIKALAGAASAHQWNLFVQGRFDWSRLQSYALHHGGQCMNSVCVLPATHPGKWIGFTEVQPDVMSLAITDNQDLAFQSPKASLGQTRPASPATVSTDPVWFCPSLALLNMPDAGPTPLRMLAIALQSANHVVVSLAPHPPAAGAPNDTAFDLKVKAVFANPVIANTALSQLQIDTNMLKLELTREHQQPNPANLTGMLTNGKFVQDHAAVLATWPVPKEFVQALR